MTETPRNKGGRPYAGGTTPQRSIRYGALWDDVARAAQRRGERMSAVVTRILDAELPRYLSGAAWQRDTES